MAKIQAEAEVRGENAVDASVNVAKRLELLRPYLEGDILLTQVASTAGIPLRTARRWVACVRKGGPAAWKRKTRSDVGDRRLANELVTLIEGQALSRPRLPIATIHRRVSNIYRAGSPNARWQADHTQLYIAILDANRTIIRLWLTTVLDDYSRAVDGYMVFLGAPSALNTSLALRQAIWRKSQVDWPVCSVADVLHVDHGSNFTSIHLDQAADRTYPSPQRHHGRRGEGGVLCPRHR